MQSSTENKDTTQRKRFEAMAVRLAKHLHLSSAEDFNSLPPSVRSAFNRFRYYEIVMPLIEHDKEMLGLSFRQLEIKYGLPKSTIQYHLTKTIKK